MWIVLRARRLRRSSGNSCDLWLHKEIDRGLHGYHGSEQGWSDRVWTQSVLVLQSAVDFLRVLIAAGVDGWIRGQEDVHHGPVCFLTGVALQRDGATVLVDDAT